MSAKSLLLIILASLSSSSAFLVPTAPSHFGVLRMTKESCTQLCSKTKLQYRNQAEDDSLYFTDSSEAIANSLQERSNQVPPSMFLPRQSQRNASRIEVMMDAEMFLGRIAMMASIIMISLEVCVGISLPDQIYNLFDLS